MQIGTLKGFLFRTSWQGMNFISRQMMLRYSFTIMLKK